MAVTESMRPCHAYKLRTAAPEDHPWLAANDNHVSSDELHSIIALGRVLVAENRDGTPVGWLRYNLFWDNIPFMNLLYVIEGYRSQGAGTALVKEWEKSMRIKGYRTLMTSTLSNEEAQHFYRKLGYRDAGGLLLPEEPMEIIFIKNIGETP